MKISPSTWLLVALPWVIWYGAIKYYEHTVYISKDAAQYTGKCSKSSGYTWDCSLEEWKRSDPNPGISGILIFASAIGISALSGWIILKRR